MRVKNATVRQVVFTALERRSLKGWSFSTLLTVANKVSRHHSG